MPLPRDVVVRSPVVPSPPTIAKCVFHKEIENEEEITACLVMHGHCPVHSASSTRPDYSRVAAQYCLRHRSIGDVQQRGIQMYSGAHLTGRLGAAQCASIVAAGERNSSAVADTNAYAHTQAHTTSHSHTDASPDSNTKSNTCAHAISRWTAEASAYGLLAGLQQWGQVPAHQRCAYQLRHHRRGVRGCYDHARSSFIHS